MLELSEGSAQQVENAPPQPLSARTQTGLLIAAIAGGLGIAGDLLLRATPWGLNALLWCAALVGGTALLFRARRLEAAGEGRWLALPVLLFAASVAWRASGTLFMLNLLAVCLALAIGAYRTRRGRLWVSGIAEYLWAGFAALGSLAIRPLVLMLQDIEWGNLPRGKWTTVFTAIARGVLIALPVLVVFGGLLMAADAVFENLVGNLFDFDLTTLFTHLFLIGFFTWLSAAFLHQTASDDDTTASQITRPGFAKIGMIESGILLGTLNLLFLAFVVVQSPYFFGGAEYLQSVGLTYAEYARRGFFELAAVAALLLPLLLGTHWLMGGTDQSKASRRLFTGLAGFSVLMIFVMIASALMRMATYTEVFGLTELRVYTTAFMGWLSLLFGWFALTVLRGRRQYFAFGAMVTGFSVLLLLNIINPDALIAATNIARGGAPTATEGTAPRAEFDSYYVTTLSGDAVPPLVAALNTMPQENRCYIAAQLLNQWTPPESVDWRTWNFGRWQAWQSVGANLGAIQAMACPDR